MLTRMNRLEKVNYRNLVAMADYLHRQKTVHCDREFPGQWLQSCTHLPPAFQEQTFRRLPCFSQSVSLVPSIACLTSKRLLLLNYKTYLQWYMTVCYKSFIYVFLFPYLFIYLFIVNYRRDTLAVLGLHDAHTQCKEIIFNTHCQL